MLMFHSPPVKVLRQGTFMPRIETLLESGYSAAFGVSVTNDDALRAVLGLPRLACIQLPDALLAGAGEDVLDTIATRELGVVTMRVLDDGDLLAQAGERQRDSTATGRAPSHRGRPPRRALRPVGMSRRRTSSRTSRR
jgi:aryl-alcohol dehydrogenase-like predicted oxidoreductase